MTKTVMKMRMKACVQYLMAHRDQAATAVEIAQALQIMAEGGDVETKRRTVRTIIRLLRDEDGYAICADIHPTEGGYWIARSDQEWRDYKEARKRQARFGFVAVRRMATASQEKRDGQGRLFEDCGSGSGAHGLGRADAWAKR